MPFESDKQRLAIQMARIVELEVQVRRFAKRVEQLWRHRAGLIALLRSIKENGGCSDRHWRSIAKILDVEDSSRAIRVSLLRPRKKTRAGRG